MENTKTMMGSQTGKVENSKCDTSDQGNASSSASSTPAAPTSTATDAGKATTSNMPDQGDASRSAGNTPEASVSTATNAGKETASPASESSGEAGSNNATVATPPSSTDGATVPNPDDTTAVTAPDAAPSTPTSTDDEPKRLDVNNFTLSFDTISDALSDGLMGREPMTIPADDVSLVKTNAKSWVSQLVAAFGTDYLAAPLDASKRSDAQKLWWARWQAQGHASVVAIFDAETKGVVHLEKSCWHLFDAVVKAHELGFITTPSVNNTSLPSKLKCSERLSFIVSTLEKYALVRLDVVRSWHVDEIAANPEIFLKRKITNCWNNGNRAMRLAANRGVTAQTAGLTRGRKRAAREMDDADETEKGAAEAPVKAKRVRKSAATTFGDSTPKTGRKAKGKVGTGVKRAVSATSETPGSDEPTSNKLVASSEAPSATGAQDDEDEGAGSGAEDDEGEDAGIDDED
jgi:hypothetical protein